MDKFKFNWKLLTISSAIVLGLVFFEHYYLGDIGKSARYQRAPASLDK